MTRWIEPDETTLSCSEIVARFEEKHGYAFHATNAGMAAKKLGLDYVEVDTEGPYKEKRYGEVDYPGIEAILVEKMVDRQRYEKATVFGGEP